MPVSPVLSTPAADRGRDPLERVIQRLGHWAAARPREGADAARPARIQGLKGGSRAFLLARAHRQLTRPFLVVTPSSKEAEALVEDLRFFLGESETAPPFARIVHYLPAWDVGAFEDLSPTAESVAARIEGLYHLQQTRNPIVVTTPDALLQRVPPRQEFAKRLRYLVQGDEVDIEALARELDDWGYRRVPLVEDRGDFAVRGGILDIFPPAHPQPLRIDFIGDLIEAIREFDPVTQRSLGEHQEFLILPVREFGLHARTSRETLRSIEARLLDLDLVRDERTQLLDALGSGMIFPGIEFFLPFFFERLDTLTDYLPAESLIWLDHAGDVDSALSKAYAEIERRAEARAEGHRYFPIADSLYLSPNDWRRGVTGRPVVEMEPLEMMAAANDEFHIPVRSYLTRDLKIERTEHREMSFAPVAAQVRAWRDEGFRVVVVLSSPPQVERVIRLFANHQVEVVAASSVEAALQAGSERPQVAIGHLAEGFRLPGDHLVVATEADIFGEVRRRRRARRVDVQQLLRNLAELKPDDFVVHIDHGVGCYRGLKHLSIAGTDGDYLHLEYSGGDRLYLPVDRINLVQKYVGGDGTAPPLDKLGGTAWETIKKKTRESILAMARELLDVHAAREIMDAKPCVVSDEYYEQFEASFPFEETADQQRAIDEVRDDLRRTKPMDRLICGDVGYGKTEVAIRAAFLTVLSGRQVAVLVPTTVLAQQHYNTFVRRLAGYPVKVAMVSRFLTKAEIKEVVDGVKAGSIDVVVGTHRLLQADMEYRDLGLLVIDEEHRFGVRHKERIKQMRNLVHVLTLTATPIPRTLQMSLLGLRDLSVIETPPIDRLAIRTYVTRHDEGLIREAIMRELDRKGQCFYVYNRVETIEMMARRIRELVPEARVGVAHGQMNEHTLEKVMKGFFDKEIDVLVCSAIIESGIDVPNANTIIIDRADHFGLAQLYQLRGRVGRSTERAYAYLMIPGEQMISRDAQMRLQALQELDDLGGGFKLAAHDLEIRGAGNLLGKQQSGHVTSVGFELYQQMMEEAIAELRGKQVEREVEPEIQLGIPAFLPESYIPDEEQRLAFYRSLARHHTAEELREIGEELTDRYGPLPPLADSFLRMMDLRRYLKAEMVVRCVLRNGWVTLQFHPEAKVDVDHLIGLVQKSRNKFKLSADYQLSFLLSSTDWDGIGAETKNVLQQLHPPR